MNKMAEVFQIPKKSANDFSLPVLGIGTYLIETMGEENGVQILQHALSSGFAHIDTAEGYADGYSEALVGKAIKKFNRKGLFITTKVKRSHLHYDDIIRSAKESMERLGTNYLDLYLIHAPNKDIPIKESMAAMDFLIENELIKNIGVSNFNSSLLEEAMGNTKNRIVNNQVHFNLSARYYEKDGTLEFCEKNNIIVTAYRVLGYNQYTPRAIEILENLSKKYRKTISQIALNWVLNKPNIVAIVKSSNKEHLKDNCEAVGWKMEAEDITFLNNNFPEGTTMNIPSI